MIGRASCQQEEKNAKRKRRKKNCELTRVRWRNRPPGGGPDSRGGTPPEPAGVDARATLSPDDGKNRVEMHPAENGNLKAEIRGCFCFPLSPFFIAYPQAQRPGFFKPFQLFAKGAFQ
jgi:hypothetical protein